MCNNSSLDWAAEQPNKQMNSAKNVTRCSISNGFSYKNVQGTSVYNEQQTWNYLPAITDADIQGKSPQHKFLSSVI